MARQDIRMQLNPIPYEEIGDDWRKYVRRRNDGSTMAQYVLRQGEDSLLKTVVVGRKGTDGSMSMVVMQRKKAHFDAWLRKLDEKNLSHFLIKPLTQENENYGTTFGTFAEPGLYEKIVRAVGEFEPRFADILGDVCQILGIDLRLNYLLPEWFRSCINEEFSNVQAWYAGDLNAKIKSFRFKLEPMISCNLDLVVKGDICRFLPMDTPPAEQKLRVGRLSFNLDEEFFSCFAKLRVVKHGDFLGVLKAMCAFAAADLREKPPISLRHEFARNRPDPGKTNLMHFRDDFLRDVEGSDVIDKILGDYIFKLTEHALKTNPTLLIKNYICRLPKDFPAIASLFTDKMPSYGKNAKLLAEAGVSTDDMPENMRCSITQDIMDDPIIDLTSIGALSDVNEAKRIEAAVLAKHMIDHNFESLFTRRKIIESLIRYDTELKAQIDAYVAEKLDAARRMRPR